VKLPPRQRPHYSLELKRIVAERGRRSRGGHLCFVWCAFQCRYCNYIIINSSSSILQHCFFFAENAAIVAFTRHTQTSTLLGLSFTFVLFTARLGTLSPRRAASIWRRWMFRFFYSRCFCISLLPVVRFARLQRAIHTASPTCSVHCWLARISPGLGGRINLCKEGDFRRAVCQLTHYIQFACHLFFYKVLPVPTQRDDITIPSDQSASFSLCAARLPSDDRYL